MIGSWPAYWLTVILLLIALPDFAISDRRRRSQWHEEINLPDEHLTVFFYNNPSHAARCRHDADCPFKMHLDRSACWGYEKNCTTKQRQYSYAKCAGDHNGWVKTKEEQEETFFRQGDFGFLKEILKEMFPVCHPGSPASQSTQSSLMCAKYLRYCRGRSVFFNFTSLQHLPEPMRYRMDVIGKGEVGGNCRVDEQRLKEEGSHMSPLQSWAPELHRFTGVGRNPEESICEVVVNEPTYILKLDATVNMYHHFCDFFNLYASLHVNGTYFSPDIRILIWDTMPYRSNFEVTWKVFTRHPVRNLNEYKGKTVCFRDVVLPLLPRMIYGMYYNMPLVSGCEGSGLFHAFSHHVLHRLGIGQQQQVDKSKPKKLRVTLLSRSTTYRRILNQDKLMKALQTKGDFHVRKVDFSWSMPFEEQLKITHNTDIFVGIHGAGLTHLLFLPDWAAVFEMSDFYRLLFRPIFPSTTTVCVICNESFSFAPSYHCEDPGCYHDLARLRGIRYFTWEKPSKLKAQDKGHHPTEGAHAKFTNYEFDVREFVRIVQRAADHVRGHPQWMTDGHPSKPIAKTVHNEL